MTSIHFLYQGREIYIPCEKKEKLSSIVERFCVKVQVDKKYFNFLYGGKILDEQTSEEKIPISDNNKRFIQVDDNYETNNPKDVVIKSNIIICPTCQESASISLDNNKITISNCKNGHDIKKINIQDFSNTQKINISKIICGRCKQNNMGTAVDHIFFRCIESKINLCSLCKAVHNSKHNVINYSNIFYTCEEHGELFTSFCFKCKVNLCFLCEEKHINHNVKSLISWKIMMIKIK